MSFETWTGLRLRAPRGRARRILVYLGRVALGLALSLGVRAGVQALVNGRPLGRQDLAARANSICAAAERKSLAFIQSALSNYPPDPGATLADMADQEVRDLGGLKPKAALAPDWHAFLAGIRAHELEFAALERGSTNYRDPGRTGRPAARRLGIHCDLLSR